MPTGSEPVPEDAADMIWPAPTLKMMPLIRTMVCDCGSILVATDGEFVCSDCGLSY
jgi:hypothetical protein